MTNSSLVSHIRISPNSNPRQQKIDTVTIHCMAGNMSVESCGEWFSKKSTGSSSNYGIGSDGRIGLYVEEKDRAWTTSSPANDHRAITIEVANITGADKGWRVSDKAIESLVRLLADICKRNGIDKLRWSGDKNLVGKPHLQNMTVHRWFKSTACPGEHLMSLHDEIVISVNRLLERDSIKGDCDYVRERAGLQEETMDYMQSYAYGDELIRKLADAMRRG